MKKLLLHERKLIASLLWFWASLFLCLLHLALRGGEAARRGFKLLVSPAVVRGAGERVVTRGRQHFLLDFHQVRAFNQYFTFASQFWIELVQKSENKLPVFERLFPQNNIFEADLNFKDVLLSHFAPCDFDNFQPLIWLQNWVPATLWIIRWVL